MSVAERILGDVLEREQQCEVLTALQAKVLDCSASTPGYTCGAGSGKT